MTKTLQAIAFAGGRRIALGALVDVAVAVKAVLDGGETAPVLIFSAVSSQPIDVDVSGSADAVRARFAAAAPDDAERGPGRPKLGVVAREVTLLPRHWDWLGAQRGGASAALRRLVDDARRGSEAADLRRQGQDALYRFITAMAGDAEGYEEATRALFAGDEAKFEGLIALWPVDIRDHAMTLARSAFGHAPSPLDGLVPAARRGAVDRALEVAFPGLALEAAQRMTWGASGAGVFRIAMAGTPYVLRLDGPPEGFRDPARQYACARIAAEAGVAPPLLHADAEARVSISAMVHAGSDTPAALDPAKLTALVRTVRRLHDAPLFAPFIPVLDAIDGTMEALKRSGVADAGEMAAALALYGSLAAAYRRLPPDLVSSHNDLNPSNVLFEGERPFLVDWETAFAADRFVDLAALANWHGADEATEASILTAYFGAAASPAQRTRLLVMRQINRLFYGAMLIAVGKAERPDARFTAGELTSERFSDIRAQMPALTTPEGRLRFGRAFIAEALHDAQTPRFTAALKTLAG